MTTRLQIIEREWECDSTPLPNELDFDPFSNLDARYAWKHFGGLSRIEAFARFKECPERYQEDFMWMGGIAFAYYYPVIERFLLDAEALSETDDLQSWILAHCIQFQFTDSDTRHVGPLCDRVIALARHVRTNLARFGASKVEQERIDDAWRSLEECLVSLKT